MSDCPNVEMREALPELLHGRLDAAQAAKVREHLTACAECAAELELLERVRRVYTAAPAIDTAAIVRMLPVPAHARTAQRQARKPSLGVLRLAAAVVLVIAGALIFRSVMGGGAGSVADTSGMIVTQPDSSPVPAATVDSNGSRVPRAASQPRVLAMTVSEVDDLDVEDLEILLGALDQIDAAPAAEPDTLIGSVRGVGSGNGN